MYLWTLDRLPVSTKYHCRAPEHGGGCGRAAADVRAWLCRAPALSPGHQALAGQSGGNLGHVEAAACNLEAWVHILTDLPPKGKAIKNHETFQQV